MSSSQLARSAGPNRVNNEPANQAVNFEETQTKWAWRYRLSLSSWEADEEKEEEEAAWLVSVSANLSGSRNSLGSMVPEPNQQKQNGVWELCF